MTLESKIVCALLQDQMVIPDIVKTAEKYNLIGYE